MKKLLSHMIWILVLMTLILFLYSYMESKGIGMDLLSFFFP